MPRSHRDISAPIVRLRGVSKRFDSRVVLRGLDLEIMPGRCTVVLGPSGCGKSVMLKHIIGLLKPDEGEVWFEDTRIDTLSEKKLGPVRKQVGYLFQLGALFDSMSVRENVIFPLREHAANESGSHENRIHEVLDLVGLSASMDQMPSELSGGQRKRVALARAIVLNPRLVLYDEPTTGLDPIRADAIDALILKLQAELQITSLVVTHDLDSAFRIADHLVMLYDGAVVAQGDPQTFRASPEPIVRQFLDAHASAPAGHTVTGGDMTSVA